jgi:Fic family protein
MNNEEKYTKFPSLNNGDIMRNYSYKNEWKKLLTPEIVAMLTAIHEYRGEQNNFLGATNDTLTHLVEIAKIQSTESSNKIEGIYTSNERLKQLVLDKTMPKTRGEEEIAGYRDVLKTIHENYKYIPLKTSYILQLHRDLYKYGSKNFAGKFKTMDNVVTEETASGEKRVRFVPLESWETPSAIEEMCLKYMEAIELYETDALLTIPMAILDFTCIHPFNDGNGRMSRLLTLLLLYRAGYHVGKYISIEKKIEQTKEQYYNALQESSKGWLEGKNDYKPFVKYMLSILIACYREFNERVNCFNKIIKSQWNSFSSC